MKRSKDSRLKITPAGSWIFVLLLAICGGGAVAYVLYSFQWPLATKVAYFINPNTSQVDGEDVAVKEAADSWNRLWPAGLSLSYKGSTSKAEYAYDGENAVFWSNEGDSGALATSWMWYSGNTMLETDMVFNDYYEWYTSGNHYDIETVALHEFGHWVGLNHSATGIMMPNYSGLQRSIDNDARDGFMAMYGHSSSTVSPVEFLPEGHQELQSSIGDNGAYIFRQYGAVETYFFTQVQLPHGVRIKYLRLHYLDNDPVYGIDCRLIRVNKYTGESVVVYQVGTAGALPVLQFATDFSASPLPSYSLTNTDACHYIIQVYFGGSGANLRVYGVTVTF
jgi:hypothetical protein